MPFLESLETKAGVPVDEATLEGKIVALYFSSSWCPPCQRFTSLLSVLHQEANEENGDDNIPFEVIHVSSDDNAKMCHEYMNKKHGDWLRISFDSSLRQALKKKYGVFAGREQGDFLKTKRRSGIPTLVVIDRNGNEKILLDCDDTKVIQEMESKGASYLSQWQAYKW